LLRKQATTTTVTKHHLDSGRKELMRRCRRNWQQGSIPNPFEFKAEIILDAVISEPVSAENSR
jgi:hypothetical protein